MYNSVVSVNENKYKLSVENFEGPMELLMFLIDKNKMSIFDIRLSEIADQYLEYIDQMEKLNMELASDFLVMASTLLYIKSKQLLPTEKEEAEDIEETEEMLIKRIQDYKKYKEVSLILGDKYSVFSKIFIKQPERIELPNKKIEQLYDKFTLVKMYNDMINRKKQIQNINSENVQKLAIYDKITVKIKVKQMLKELISKSKFVFGKLFKLEKVEKIEIVTAFLGMLELAKNKKAIIKQDKLFGEILVEKIKENN